MPDLIPPKPDGAPFPAASRRWLADLAALLALPAMWLDHGPDDIAAGLLGVLFGVFRLDSAYARFEDSAGGPALERWRPAGPNPPQGLQPAIASEPMRYPGAATTSVAAPDGLGNVRVTSMPLSLPGAESLVVVASRRPDFPTELELHLLRVAAGQAVIAVRTARSLASERAARQAAEFALQRRNDFLAALAEEWSSSASTLAERARQAVALATEPNQLDPIAGQRDLIASAGTYVPAPESIAPRLTRREVEVLGLLAQGLSNKDIAAVMWLSERTVERHIGSLYRKIEVERRSEATAYALRHGFGDGWRES